MNKNLKAKILLLRSKGKTYKEISSVLNCSKGTISFHCSKLKENQSITQNNTICFNFDHWSNDLKSNIKVLYDYGIQMTEISDIFNINLNEVQIFCKKLKKPSYKDLTNYQKVKRRRKKIKVLGVIYKGGKCQKCGYNKYFENLEFHHKNPKEKDFTISQKCNHRWLTIKKELDKCACLCSTCHRELHVKLHNNIEILPTDLKIGLIGVEPI
jgi:transcriptional regulator